MKFRNKVFVSEFGLRSVSLDLMLELRRALAIHVARIPLVTKRRHRIDAPMDKDPELGILIPVRNLVSLQRIPVWLEWPFMRGLVHSRQHRSALLVIFRHRFLPDNVVRIRFLCDRSQSRSQHESPGKGFQTTHNCQISLSRRGFPSWFILLYAKRPFDG